MGRPGLPAQPCQLPGESPPFSHPTPCPATVGGTPSLPPATLEAYSPAPPPTPPPSKLRPCSTNTPPTLPLQTQERQGTVTLSVALLVKDTTSSSQQSAAVPAVAVGVPVSSGGGGGNGGGKSTTQMHPAQAAAYNVEAIAPPPAKNPDRDVSAANPF